MDIGYQSIPTSLGEVEITQNGTAFLFGSERKAFSAAARPVRKETGKPSASQPWALWYKDSNNLEPLDILEVLTNNNINPGILSTIVDFAIGDGLMGYREVVVDGKKTIQVVDLNQEYPQVYDFIEGCDLNAVMRNACTDSVYFGNAFFQMIHTAGGEKGQQIAQMQHLDASTMRAEEMQAMKINAYYYSPDWAKYRSFNDKAPEKSVVKRTQSFDQGLFNPRDNAGISSVYHSKRYLPGHPYYSLPAWYGAMTWIRLANEIPFWHLSGITNGYNIKYLVEVNEAYFQSIPQEQREKAKTDLRTSFDNYLAGGENAKKSVTSFVPPALWEKGLVRITPVGGDLNDAAFTQLFAQSNMAMTSAHGLDPTLAGVETAGKLSSGSEKRMAYEIYLSLKTKQPRELLLNPLRAVAKVNRWPADLKFGFANTQITTLDKNPTGTQTVIAG